MQRSHPIATFEELQDLITDSKSSFDGINISAPDGLQIFEYLLEKYVDNMNRAQSEFIAKTCLSQDSYRKLRGYKGGKVGKEILIKTVFGLGTTYEEAVILFMGFGYFIVADTNPYKTINIILFELNNLYGKTNSCGRREILYGMAKAYKFKLRKEEK